MAFLKWLGGKAGEGAVKSALPDEMAAAVLDVVTDETKEDAAQSIKTADFSSKITDVIDSVYGEDEDLLDLIAKDGNDKKIPGVLAKVSQELFANDFALEESLSRRRLLPFLFEGSYGWAEVQKSIDKYAEDVPKDLLYTIFAKAVPSFQEMGVEVSGVPEPDIEGLKATLSGEEVDPDAELGIEDPAGLSDEDQKKDDLAAKKLASTLGSGPVKKHKLAALLKQAGDITGKGQPATRARRKFRMAINQAAGTKIFEEAFDLGRDDAEKYVLNESTETDAIARWKKLAGIE
jgi:hypothetical protein